MNVSHAVCATFALTTVPISDNKKLYQISQTFMKPK